MEFDQFVVDPGSNETGPLRQRTYYKCRFCRKRKIKCLPEERSWPGQRCQNCINSHQPCGPNELSERPPPQQSPPRSATLPYPTFPTHDSTTAPFIGSFSETVYSPELSSSSLGSSWTVDPAWIPTAGDSGTPFKGRRPQSGGGEQRYATNPPPKTRDVIKSKLYDLGCLIALYEYLKARHRASLQEQPARRFHIFSDVERMIMDLLHSIQMRFDAICEHILGQLQSAQSTEKELFLRRLFDSIGSFLDASGHPVEDAQHGETGTWALQRKVAEQLIHLYESMDDFPEARRFRSQLTKLRKQHGVDDQDDGSHHEAISFVKMSEQVSQAFRALGFPRRCRDVSKGAHKDVPPAHLAVYSGRFKTATSILQGNINPDYDMDILDRSLSHLAVESRNKDLLQAALDKSDARDDRDVYSMTPLAVAARIGDLDMFKVLHKANYCLNARDIAGRSVLCIAAGAGAKEIVEYMLSCGCSPAQTYDLEQGRALRSEFSNAYSPLHAAAAGGHMEIVKLLLRFNASVMYVSNDRTPSQEARTFEHHDVADHLHAIEEQRLLRLEKQLGEHAKGTHPFSAGNAGDVELQTSATPASTSYSPSSFEIVPSHAARSMQRQQSAMERSRKRIRESSRSSSPAISDVTSSIGTTTSTVIRQSSVPRPSPSQLSSQA